MRIILFLNFITFVMKTIINVVIKAQVWKKKKPFNCLWIASTCVQFVCYSVNLKDKVI